MSENELIGEAGVVVFTVLLIALYHFALALRFGRHRKRDDAQIKPLKNPDGHRHADFDLRKESAADDAWLLWSPELDTQAGSSNRVREGLAQNREHTEKRNSPFR